ncbi:hypothetical protein CMK20_05985 [Candidatus Poribacteria bacterium]|nr:hypothetical protein [Candidatus Poribacteria bacterium]
MVILEAWASLVWILTSFWLLVTGLIPGLNDGFLGDSPKFVFLGVLMAVGLVLMNKFFIRYNLQRYATEKIGMDRLKKEIWSGRMKSRYVSINTTYQYYSL